MNIGDALEMLGAPAHLEVLAERNELMRFAASRITYQHSEERVLVRARIVRDGRVAWGTTSSLAPADIGRLRERLEAIASALPRGPEPHLKQACGDEASVCTYFAATARAGATERAALLREALAALPSGATAGGSIAHSDVEHSVADTEGLRRRERRTRAAVQVIGALGGRTSYARALHRDSSALPVQAVLHEVRRGLAPLPLRALEPGTYRAVLGPQATITLLAIYAQIALGGRQFLDGLSAVSGRMGERVASPLVSLTDDGCDAAGLPTSFDPEGRLKRRVPLLESGVLAGVVHDAQTAQRAETLPTGHTAPPGWRFGADPIPSHLFMASGQASDADLLEACGTGLRIQRVDYVRVVNARQTLVSGTTRDATEWLEHGRVVARVPQFRFTLRLADLLGCIEAAGAQRERGDSVFMESVVAPAVVVSALPVQLVAAD
jgi:predicted Zn-dependent protease